MALVTSEGRNTGYRASEKSLTITEARNKI
jgi:hypothetical protein